MIIRIHESRGDKVAVARSIQSQISARRDQAPEDYIRLSQAWDKAGSTENAIAACLKGVNKNSTHLAARTQCARMYAKMGDLESAVGHAPANRNGLEESSSKKSVRLGSKQIWAVVPTPCGCPPLPAALGGPLGEFP